MSSRIEKGNKAMGGSPDRVPALLTDLYELTMAAGYFAEQMLAPATFSLCIRTHPKDWGYFICAGLDDALTFLENLRFAEAEIDYLSGTGMFSGDFLEMLSELRFTGDVRAMKEGEIFFADEPILEVTAPIVEAQIVETYLINALHLQSMICTKASRCIVAAAGRPLIDFSLRRTHGVDAGMKVARASHIAGFKATSNVLAGQRYGIPISGTMAHSYITAFEDEAEAFRAFARAHPDNTVLLIDTFDTISGARKACEVGREMEASGHRLRGVRLDSGDMAALSKRVRSMLDEAGLDYATVLASGGFDEYRISDVLEAGALIDGFGVGTNMGVSMDAPSVDMAYKLVEYEGRSTLKLSEEKVTLPGAKQVFRTFDGSGLFAEDTIGLRGESAPQGSESLLVDVMKEGRRIFTESLEETKRRCVASMKKLPAAVAKITDPAQCEAVESEALKIEIGRARSRAEKQIR